MGRDYPVYGNDVKVEQMDSEFSDRNCECCIKDTHATHAVYVHVDYMRGNDEVYFVCPFHVGMARHHGRFHRFLDDYRKKVLSIQLKRDDAPKKGEDDADS